MEKNKTQSNLRIIFSSIALTAFVLFALCDNLVVSEYASYQTYGWRLGVLNNLFLLVPFLSLLVFAVIERKLRFINSRAYVAGIFGIYLIQALAIFLCDGASKFSTLCCHLLGSDTDIGVAIMIVRMVMLILIPIAHKMMIKIYSLGMIALSTIFIFSTLTSDYLMLRTGTSIIIASLIDILFHIALFFFGNLLDKENESTPWLCFLGNLMYPVFGEIFDEDDELDEFEECMDGRRYTSNKTSEYGLGITECDAFDKPERWLEFFRSAITSKEKFIEINGSEFLLDSPEDGELCYTLKYKNDIVTICGMFLHKFYEEQSARILRKKSILNQTFKDLHYNASTDTNIGVESNEEGKFFIVLKQDEFDLTEGDKNACEYMLRFMESIILIQNTESVE